MINVNYVSFIRLMKFKSYFRFYIVSFKFEPFLYIPSWPEFLMLIPLWLDLSGFRVGLDTLGLILGLSFQLITEYEQPRRFKTKTL